VSSTPKDLNPRTSTDTAHPGPSAGADSVQRTGETPSEVRLAAELRDREERLREQATLLDEASDAIILRELDGTVRFWNRSAERLFGWTHAEATGRKPEELFFRGTQRPDEAATRVVIAQGVWNGEIEHQTRTGARILVESRWTLIRNSAGEPRAILTINTDVTEKRHVEANLLRAQRLESIGTLAGGIAHDLNNILAPIILSGDMLRPRLVGTPDEELIDTICASARRGADVVRQVLSFARGVESTRVPVNLRHLLPEIRKIVRETFRRDITCTAEAPADLWTIHADPTQVHQVLLNLCINAADAMPRGGALQIDAANIDLTTTQLPNAAEARPGIFVRVRVADTGCGIPESIRHRIFDPFFTTKGVGRGTGLGLSTALAIVRGHHGFITVDTEVGQGTTFRLYFPAEPVVVSTQPAIPSHNLPRGRGEVVLIIDDEQSVRAMVRQGLESVGYRVLLAGDGTEGIAQFTQHRREVALVLTDLMMPAMDGLGVIKALQEQSPGVRIIAMSGVTEFTDEAAPSIPAGAVGFLLKPFALETLLTTVRQALDDPTHFAIQ
jgi:two-component system, cell cycle sensor histidine kinase and response regulator CckA